MLLNLLPGFRHVRTPLITGLLILTTAGLALGSDRLIPHRDGNQLERSLVTAANYMPATGVIAVVSFLAYLIGSVAIISSWPFAESSPVRGTERDRAFGAPSDPFGEYGFDDFEIADWAEDLQSWGWSFASDFDRRLTIGEVSTSVAPRYFREAVERRIYEELEDQYGEFRDNYERVQELAPGDEHDTALSQLRRQMSEFIDHVSASVEPPFVEEDDRLQFNFSSEWWSVENHFHKMVEADTLNHALLEEINAELKTATAKMRVDSPALYDDYDRKRSEAELRYSISGPCVALIVTVAAISSWWSLLALILPAILLRQGFLSERSATADLLAAIRYGAISSPSEDALRRSLTLSLEQRRETRPSSDHP